LREDRRVGLKKKASKKREKQDRSSRENIGKGPQKTGKRTPTHKTGTGERRKKTIQKIKVKTSNVKGRAPKKGAKQTREKGEGEPCENCGKNLQKN